jgi:ketosteroid isomerase-like protein
MIKRSIMALCLLSLPGHGLHAQSAVKAPDALSGTWFGDFVLTSPNGKASYDTAVLILDRRGSALTGSVGRTVDQQTPYRDGRFNRNRVSFHLDAAGGLDFVLTFKAGKLTGIATGRNAKATISLKPAPGLLPKQLLIQEITRADQQLFDAFATCDVARYTSFLGKDLEFYQDHTGKTNYEQNIDALRNRCAEGIRLRRELDKDSLIVDAAPGFGAIEAGTQRFYSKNPDGSEHLDATARFTNLWSKETGTWKLVRVISYDHR